MQKQLRKNARTKVEYSQTILRNEQAKKMMISYSYYTCLTSKLINLSSRGFGVLGFWGFGGDVSGEKLIPQTWSEKEAP